MAALTPPPLADDWFHAVLHYGSLRVILHASALTAQPAPRFVLHGTQGSFVKDGLDPQEAALKEGVRPGGAGWSLDPEPGLLTMAAPRQSEVCKYPSVAGDYTCYYQAMRDAILNGAPVPVSARSACDVMRLIDAGLRSRRRVKLLIFINTKREIVWIMQNCSLPPRLENLLRS